MAYVTGCCLLFTFYDSVCGITYGQYTNCVPVKNAVFWDVMPCRLIEICQHFKITCTLHLQVRQVETHLFRCAAVSYSEVLIPGTRLPGQLNFVCRYAGT
jgi:hypothetical protein